METTWCSDPDRSSFLFKLIPANGSADHRILVVDPDGKVIAYGSRNDDLGANFGEKAEVTAQITRIEDQAKEMLKGR